MKIETGSELMKFKDLEYGAVFRGELESDYCIKLDLSLNSEWTAGIYNTFNLASSFFRWVFDDDFVRFYPNAVFLIHANKFKSRAEEIKSLMRNK